MYGIVHQHKHRGLGERGVIREYDCLIATPERLDGNDDKEAHRRLLGAQDRVAVSCRVLARFTLLSATSFGVRDAIN